jgi:putative ABC transport system permease protein
MQDVVAESMKPRQFSAFLVGAFAATAMFLAVLGIYGVIAFGVTQRTQEIGIRMALGAERRAVLRLFLREGLLLAAIGIAIGAAVAIWLGRYMGTLLYGVRPADPGTLTIAAASMLITALIATYLPARRATRLDPMLALRE